MRQRVDETTPLSNARPEIPWSASRSQFGLRDQRKGGTSTITLANYCKMIRIDNSRPRRGYAVQFGQVEMIGIRRENVHWPNLGGSLHFGRLASKLLPLVLPRGSCRKMLLARDYVAHMASEVVKRLVEDELIETKATGAVVQRVRHRMMEEITVEDRLNDEVRDILTQHQDEIRRTGVSYQEMYKKVKAQLARDRKLVLR
jgi:hypothetical protein